MRDAARTGCPPLWDSDVATPLDSDDDASRSSARNAGGGSPLKGVLILEPTTCAEWGGLTPFPVLSLSSYLS